MKRFALLAAATLALAGCATEPPPIKPSVQKYYDENVANRKATLAPRVAPVVAFLGDSFTSGSGANAGGGYANLLTRHMGWQGVVMGQGGTGYTNPGQVEEKESPFGGRVAEVIKKAPDVVIVQGSTNDYEARATEGAAAEVFSKLRAGLPKAKIVAVGPVDAPGTDPLLVRAARDGVAAAAKAEGVTFIDPIALKWMPDDRLFPDGIHPSQEGHRIMADLLRKALVKAGVKPV